MLSHTFAGSQSGSLLVFLHAAGTTSWMWDTVVERLQHRRCMLIDLPGHGGSRATRWQSLDETARLVHQTISMAEPQKDVHLVGLSLGAYVAMTLLAQRPTAYASATLSGMHAGAMPNATMMRLITRIMTPLTVRPFMARKTAKFLGGSGTDVDAYVRQARKVDVPSLRQAGLDAIAFEMPANALPIATRVMVAAGSKEHPHILETQQTIVSALPNAQGHIAPGLGHGWSMEDPDQFAAMIDRQIQGEAGQTPDSSAHLPAAMA
ncbi:MAG: alpha/beta hydrolase [Pseudomonadota bacterium]